MPLVAQMSCNILAMQSTKDQVPGPLETVLADMEAKKDDMETCLGLLLELASGMAEAGQNCCHKLQCLHPHVLPCLGLVMQVMSICC